MRFAFFRETPMATNLNINLQGGAQGTGTNGCGEEEGALRHTGEGSAKEEGQIQRAI